MSTFQVDDRLICNNPNAGFDTEVIFRGMANGKAIVFDPKSGGQWQADLTWLRIGQTQGVNMHIPITQLIEMLQHAVDAAVRMEHRDPAQTVSVYRDMIYGLLDLARIGADEDTSNLIEMWDKELK
jgi:hypothetical protein